MKMAGISGTQNQLKPHGHEIEDITGLQDVLGSKATQSDIDNAISGLEVDQSNVKAFTLTSGADLKTAQAAYDWYLAGKNPIIVYGGKTYILTQDSSYPTALSFVAPDIFYSIRDGSATAVGMNMIRLYPSGDTVRSINTGSKCKGFLDTDVSYNTPYIPRYDGSPATKKYVDDAIASAIANLNS